MFQPERKVLTTDLLRALVIPESISSLGIFDAGMTAPSLGITLEQLSR